MSNRFEATNLRHATASAGTPAMGRALSMIARRPVLNSEASELVVKAAEVAAPVQPTVLTYAKTRMHVL